MAGLVLSQVCKAYAGTTLVLDHLDFEVPQGELVSLLGPSGCGKSTALRIVGGLIPASSGRITVGGRDVTALPAHTRNMGMVFQNYALFPHITVAGNVAFGLEMRGVARREALRRAQEALETVGLGGLAGRMPRQLSGGQQQRVALARALVIRPDLLLLDEPLSNLDAQLRERMRTEIRELQQKTGITTVFVTHDQSEALTMSDRVAILDKGRVAQYGTPLEIYERPTNEFVASFIGRVNTLVGVAGARRDGLTPVMCPGNFELRTTETVPGGPVTLMVRPQRMRLADAIPQVGANRVTATVTSVSFSGETINIAARTGDWNFAMEVSSTGTRWRTLTPGAEIAVEWAPSDTLAFAGTA